MDVEVDKECCRTCLETTTDNFLFDNPELVKKLEFTTSLRINQSDGLPIYFCNSCQNKLEIAYQFRLQSIRSYKHLKNHIRQIRNQFQSIVKGKKELCKDLTDNDAIDLLESTKTNSDKYLKEDDSNNYFEYSNDPLLSNTKRESIKKRKRKSKRINGNKHEIKKSSNEIGLSKTLIKETADKYGNDDVYNKNDGVEFARCDVCQKMFRKGNLKRHKEIHTGDRKFTCKICNKNFTQKSSLQRHHLTHTGEKPHKCEICGKKFSQKGILKFHMTLHGKEKTFNCSICRYRFIRPENLANHMREKHSSGNADEVTLFVCQFCNKAFKSKYTLKVHKEKVHKDDLVFNMDWSDINNEDSKDDHYSEN